MRGRRITGRVNIAYPGTLGVTTEKGQQDVKPLVLDAPTESYPLMLLRWETGVFEVGAPPPTPDIVAPSIVFSPVVFAENAANGTVLGYFSVSNGTGTYVFTETADPDGVFSIVGNEARKAGTMDFEAGKSYTLTLKADNGKEVLTGTFTVTPTNVPEITLAALSLNDVSTDEDVLWSATIVGKTAGSTITATSSDGTILTVNGSTITGTFANPGTPNITLTETHPDAINNGRQSVVGITIVDVVEGVAGFRYIAPTAQGTGDGSSWANAAPLNQLNSMIAAVGNTVGGTVAIASHLGNYTQTSSIAINVRPANRVTITGMNGSNVPAKATIIGNRTAWTAPADASGAVNASGFGGNTLFLAQNGIGNLSFKMLAPQRLSRVIDFSGVTASDFLFEDFDCYNLRDGFYQNSTSSVTNVVLRRFNAIGFSKMFMRIRGTSHTYTVEDCVGDSRWQDRDNFATGIAFNDTAHGITLNNCEMNNCLDTLNSYRNGDGFASERGNYDFVYNSPKASGNSDGGLDLKSETTVINNPVLSGNKRNLRIWGGLGFGPGNHNVVVNNLVSTTPVHPGGSGSAHHIWIDGGDDASSRGGNVTAFNATMTGGPSGMISVGIDGHNAGITFTGTFSHTPASGGSLNGELLSGSYVTVGGVATDTTPNQFTFTDVANATQSTVYTSNTITVQGINDTASITISGGTYSKNGGAYTSSAGTVVNGDTVSVRVTSSANYSTSTSATLTIGGVSDTFSVATLADPNVEVSDVTFLGRTYTISTTGAGSVARPTGIQAGTRLIVQYVARGQVTPPTVIGFDLVGSAGQLHIYSRIAEDGSAAPIEFSGGPLDTNIVACFAWNGVAGIEGLVTEAAPGSSTTRQYPSVTASSSGRYGVAFGAAANDYDLTLATPNGWEVVDQTIQYIKTTQGQDATAAHWVHPALAPGANAGPLQSHLSNASFDVVAFALTPGPI